MDPWIKLYKEKKSSALEKAKESGIEEIIEIIRSRGAGIDECFKISKFKNKKDLVAGIGKGLPPSWVHGLSVPSFLSVREPRVKVRGFLTRDEACFCCYKCSETFQKDYLSRNRFVQS